MDSPNTPLPLAPAPDAGPRTKHGWLYSTPAPLLVLGSVVSTQIGAALAKTLFATVGTAGAVFIRVGLAALMLLALSRPKLRGLSARHVALVVLFGLVLGGMNWSFYAALSRVPLGIAVTVEFIGPLGVAVAHSRRPRDLLWVALAAAGIALLSPIGAGGPDPIGVALALLAGACWATYILVGARVGRAFSDSRGLALAMLVAALALAPGGAAGASRALGAPVLILTGIVVALTSSALPYSLEMEALRRMPARVFGVLMSLEPAVAALAGFLMLHEHLGPRALAALVLISAASAGVTAFP